MNRLKNFELDDVVVACVREVSAENVTNFGDVGLRWVNGALEVPPAFVPARNAGRYSRANVEGEVVVRRDLPKTFQTYTWEAPNYGDWSKGSTTHSRTQEVYQRDFIPPKEVTLSISILRETGGKYAVKFAVDQVLKRGMPEFEAELLYNLNILQENVGAVDLFTSEATLEEFLATVRVDWEILPPGHLDEVVRHILAARRTVSEQDRRQIMSRLQVFERLRPQAYIAGTSGFSRYFGAQYGEDFVVFENVTYGNALYVMYENWADLSRRSRIDLLRGPREGFERILHKEGWDDRLASLLAEYRRGRAR